MAELEFKEVVIVENDVEYNVKITYFMGSRALALAARIGRKILPVFKSLGHLDNLKFVGGKLDFTQLVIGKDFFGVAVDALLTSIDEKDVLSIVLDMAKNTEINGIPLNRPELFDITFQGKPGLMLQVIKLIFVENFSPFFPRKDLIPGLSMEKNSPKE